MPKKPTGIYNKVPARPHKSLHTIQVNRHQNGFLFLPQESLTHITSYLPPPALLALACTCRHLCEHVDDDNTWLRALLNQCLGISPEFELENAHSLLLKRTENTWRKELIHRYDVRRHWERSRGPTVTHSPQDASIDGTHLMSEHGLLTSSIQYGVVARSIPLNGKVLQGYIDAAGTGLGIGNPNLEFTPNVSACAMSSDGGTACVFWGKLNGEVALTIVNRVMGPHATSKFIRCSVTEQHEGAVQQLIPDADTNTFLSAGADGRIKLWDTKTLHLLWSTDKRHQSLVVDPFVSIAGSLGDGFVAGALKSGDILLYDLRKSETPDGRPRVHSVHQLQISPPIHDEREDALPQLQTAKLWLYHSADTNAVILVQYTNHPQVYCIRSNVQFNSVSITAFGDSSFGRISTLELILSDHARNTKMLILGDILGFVSIYDADAALQTQTPVVPVHRFEAHTDDAVTAISWSPTVFATGSARGTTVVWDALTLEPVRCFPTPAPRPAPGSDWVGVSRIWVDEELIVIVVGSRVMTWKVGRPNRSGYTHKTKHVNHKIHVTSKGHQQYEMFRDIAESYKELEYERAYVQRIYGCEREQRSTLDMLGLSELEAVKYVLMLSREDEEARQQQWASVEDGFFEGDLPHAPTPSQTKVSPSFMSAPMDATFAMGPSSLSGPVTVRSTSSSRLDHFPAISSSLSLTSSSGASTIPVQPRSAEGTPLKMFSDVVRNGRVFQAMVADAEMDDDLKLAIELSLAEARSRGQV